jgi:hypothetical protein
MKSTYLVKWSLDARDFCPTIGCSAREAPARADKLKVVRVLNIAKI